MNLKFDIVVSLILQIFNKKICSQNTPLSPKELKGVEEHKNGKRYSLVGIFGRGKNDKKLDFVGYF